MAFIRVVGDLRIDYRDARKPVVRKNVEFATGSGFVITPSGLVLTSRHVVETEPWRDGEADVTLENPQIQVFVGSGGGGGAWQAYVVASDAGSDLAALQVTAADLPYLPFGDSDALEAGRGRCGCSAFRSAARWRWRRRMSWVIPQVTVTAGSLSAAREDAQGETRFLQTDAAVQPGNSGGPMLDEDGYVVGVVKMKLSRDATSQGAGFSVPINLVKDFLDANSLLERLPVTRLRPGVRHSFDWKRLAVELPDGYLDRSSSRVLIDAGEIGEVSFRADRWATPWPAAGLAEALLGGDAARGFVPAPATRRHGGTLGKRAAVALAGAKPASVIGSAEGTDATGERFRVEYAIVDLGKEKVVARYLGPADAVAFNLGLIHRSLQSLEAAPMLAELMQRPLAGAQDPALEVVSLPGGRGAGRSTRGLAARAGSAVGLRPDAPGRQRPGGEPSARLHVGAAGAALERGRRGARPGGRGLRRGRRGGWSGRPGRGAYAFRVDRLGVPIGVRGALVSRNGERLLLELEAPLAKLEVVDVLYARWVREIATDR